MRAVAIAKYLSLLVGLGLLVGAFFLYQSSAAFLDQAASAQGTVTELIRTRSEDSVTYRPVVEFTAEGGAPVEFVSPAGSNPPGYSPGERVEVLYDPTNPVDARLTGFFSAWGAPLILGGLGAAFFLSGLAMFVVPGFNARNDKALMETGLRIESTFQGVERNTGLSVNGKNPYQVVSQWLNPATMQVHVFKSANIWFDPSTYISTDTVAVYIEQDNPKNYYMDLSFLPALAK
ncbi:DUF3592 domain-containing protein [Vreelandella sp. EE7]